MQKTELRPTPVVVEVVCDICGASCGSTRNDNFVDFEFATLSASWGYGSSRDGECHHIDLCEACFDSALGHLDRRRKGDASRAV